ncbi:MAG: peptidoglycan-binding protein [Rhodospirillales bacterium]
MKDDLLLEDASFELIMPEFNEDQAILVGETGGIASPPANRTSPAYIRWVQESLNNILGLRLATDGRMGPQTRSAIRDFQRRNGLTADGNVGPATERALATGGAKAPTGGTTVTIPPGDRITPAAARIDGFDFDRSDLKPQHKVEIARVAAQIAVSWRAGHPFRTVYVVGHTDPEGSSQHNLSLGLRRALAARRELTDALKRQGSSLASKVLILAKSKGESELIDTSRTPAGQARNRRVEIFLSTQALAAIRKPPKTIALPDVVIKGTHPLSASTCDKEALARRFRACQERLSTCLAKCDMDLKSILARLNSFESIDGCLALKQPVAVQLCALAKGGAFGKDLIDDYFRISGCKRDCERMIGICNHYARINSHCR